MTESEQRTNRLEEVRQIFEDNGFDLDLLEDWDGDDLRDLSEYLTEDEFQTLLDRLGYEDEWMAG